MLRFLSKEIFEMIQGIKLDNLYISIKKFKKHFIFLFDLIIWNLSFYLAFGINKNCFSISGFENLFFSCLFLLNICFSTVFLLFKLYNRIWRYADVEDFFYVGFATFCSNFIFCILSIFLNMNLGIRTYAVFLSISEFSICLSRIIYRINLVLDKNYNSNHHKKRLLIVGAGEAAAMVLKEISKKNDSEYLPICISDDDRSKIGRSILGTKVCGSTYEIPDICKNENIEIILFTIINISNQDKRRILDICSKTNLEVRVIPKIYETFISEPSLVPSIRNVEIEDLLGRDPVIFDAKQYGEYIIGKNVLVTGGGGSIGSELCRQIYKLNPNKLIILDICENGAYDIQQEIKMVSKNESDTKVEVEIASVRDKDKMDFIFNEKKIDVVFHAAAHKHVPLMETNPEEAIKNNVFGTWNVSQCAEKYRVKKFVLISTDKAVNPTSVMGATKRVCELIVQYMAESSKYTEFVAVRFGNVLGSNGSVIPLFREQIKRGGPVTVTHPEIIRYFMTIPEAVSLVMTAGSMAHGGEIFVLDMGDPVKIKDLAENLIRLSGFIPNKDIKIEYVGLRPGEKLYEELLIANKDSQKTENNKIYVEYPSKLNRYKFIKNLKTLKEASNHPSEDIRSIIFELI